jgi:hypothetical protein
MMMMTVPRGMPQQNNNNNNIVMSNDVYGDSDGDS